MNWQAIFKRPCRRIRNHNRELRPRSLAVRRLSVEALERRELLTVGSLLHTLDNPTPAAYDVFGVSVALSEDMAAVGAQGDDTGASGAGSAYLFDAATGNLVHSIPNPAPAVNDYFGFSIAAWGDTVLAGAPWL